MKKTTKKLKLSFNLLIASIIFLITTNIYSQGGAKWYITSNAGEPWGSTANTSGMSTVFGANWSTGFFQTIASMSTICQPSTCLIFIEGGDGNATDFDTFLQANLTILQNWVFAGGRLFLNAAPNTGGNINYGFGGVTLNYNGNNTFEGTGNVAPGMGAHPVFNAPYTPAGAPYTGNWFSHAYVSGGTQTAVIVGALNAVPLRHLLSELNWGSGKVMFGGMTTANWHNPTPNGQNKFNNILSYLNVCCPASTINAVASQTSICSGTSVSITITSPGNFTFQPGGIVASSLVVTPNVSTNYSIVGTSTNGACPNIKNITVLVNALTLSLTTLPDTVCTGKSSVITVTGGASYTFNPGNLTGNSFTVSPVVPTIYTVSGISAAGCPNSATVSVFTKPTPTVSFTSVTPSVICSGTANPVTFNVSGASFYTLNPGGAMGLSPLTDFPLSTTIYTLYGETNGCSSQNNPTFVVSAINSPTITVNSGTICVGSTFTITPSGASTYTFLNGLSIVTPLGSGIQTHSVIGTNSVGCVGNVAVSTINVVGLPTVTAVASKTAACAKDKVIITAGGANTYTWSNAATGSTVAVTTSVTTVYTVTGTDAFGCVNSKTVSIKVNPCTGLMSFQNEKNDAAVFPNPGAGKFTLQIGNYEGLIYLEIYNSLGQLILSKKVDSENTDFNISEQPKGLYYLKLKGSENQKVLKLIKE